MQLSELGEHQSQARLNFLVRVESDLAAPVMDQPSRKRHPQLTSRRLLKLTLMQPNANLVQLRLAHDAGKPQQ